MFQRPQSWLFTFAWAFILAGGIKIIATEVGINSGGLALVVVGVVLLVLGRILFHDASQPTPVILDLPNFATVILILIFGFERNIERFLPMETLWKVAFGVGGIGAVGFFVFLMLYKGVLNLPDTGVFSQMTPTQTFALMLSFLFLTFLALVGGLYVYLKKDSDSSPQKGSQRVEIHSITNFPLARTAVCIQSVWMIEERPTW